MQSDKSLPWPSLVSFLAVLASFLGASVGALCVVLPGALAPAAEPEALATRRCPECGWIESRRAIASGADNRAIQLQEYTVRMADGSSRVFTTGPGERWRLSERLKVIDGGR
jgi:hypothetical protein